VPSTATLEDEGCSTANSCALEKNEYADWQASGWDKWTLPVGGGFGNVFRIGTLPFNANIGYDANVVRPDQGADA
jgi:hypothetical protein